MTGRGTHCSSQNRGSTPRPLSTPPPQAATRRAWRPSSSGAPRPTPLTAAARRPCSTPAGAPAASRASRRSSARAPTRAAPWTCGQFPLQQAVARRDLPCARALLAAGAARSAPQLTQALALTAAVTPGGADLAMMELLLDSGAAPGAEPVLSALPLCAAACEGSARVVAALLAAGADPHAEGPFGTTATLALCSGRIDPSEPRCPALLEGSEGDFRRRTDCLEELWLRGAAPDALRAAPAARETPLAAPLSAALAAPPSSAAAAGRCAGAALLALGCAFPDPTVAPADAPRERALLLLLLREAVALADERSAAIRNREGRSAALASLRLRLEP